VRFCAEVTSESRIVALAIEGRFYQEWII
jgi:hypothetical protein